MAKARRGRYTEKPIKLRVNSKATAIKGESQPSLRLTFYLSKDAVLDISRQIERFVRKHKRKRRK
jgi:hypothetical protein